MTTVFGNQIEPGGMLLDKSLDQEDCPNCCSANAFRRDWEQNDGGCINQYHRHVCNACGFSEGNDDDEEYLSSRDDEAVEAMQAEWEAEMLAEMAAERRAKLNPMYWVRECAEAANGHMYSILQKVKKIVAEIKAKVPNEYERTSLKIEFEYKLRSTLLECKFSIRKAAWPLIFFIKYDARWFFKQVMWKIRMLPRNIVFFPIWLISTLVVFLVPKQMLRNCGAWVLTRPWVRRKLRELLQKQPALPVLVG